MQVSHWIPISCTRRISNLPIDIPYVEGVSITHGSPCSHIWSLAAGVTETYIGYTAICPCLTDNGHTGPSPPSFVGDNYYCELGYSGSELPDRTLYTNDPLWDGMNCEGTCPMVQSGPIQVIA